MVMRRSKEMKNFWVIIYVILFGGAIGVFAKFALSAFPPVSLIFIRILLSLLFFTLILLFQKKLKETFKIILAHWRALAALAVSGVILGMIVSFVGLDKSSAINYSLLFNAAPLAMIFLSAWILKEKIKKIDLLLFAAALFGSLFIITQGNWSFEVFGRKTFIGDILIFGGAVCWGLYSLLGPRFQKRLKANTGEKDATLSLVVIYGTFLLAAIIMTPLIVGMGLNNLTNLVLVEEISLSAVLSAILLSLFSTALLFVLWLKLVNEKGAVFSSFVALLEDVAGAILPIVFLGEALTLPTIIGGGVVIVASTVQVTASAKQNKKKPVS